MGVSLWAGDVLTDPEISWKRCKSLSEDKHWGGSSYEYTHNWVCVYVHCMHGLCDTAKEVRGRISRCPGLGEVLTRPQLCQICPNQTRGAEKTLAAHQGLPYEGNGEKRREGGPRFHHNFSNLVSARGQELRFQRVKKAVTISGKIMRFWFVEWRAELLFTMSYRFGGSVYWHVIPIHKSSPLTPSPHICGTARVSSVKVYKA